jgi:hypothetical protein
MSSGPVALDHRQRQGPKKTLVQPVYRIDDLINSQFKWVLPIEAIAAVGSGQNVATNALFADLKANTRVILRGKSCWVRDCAVRFRVVGFLVRIEISRCVRVVSSIK